MKKNKKYKKSFPIPGEDDTLYPEESEAVSGTGMTGLVPTPPENPFEEESYGDIYPGGGRSFVNPVN